MTSRSSIFSFNTLKLPRTFPKATLFAIVLLIVCELVARYLVASKKIEVDMSLRKTLVQRIERIEQKTPQLWILGNSTLDYGIDEAALAKDLGVDVIKLSHGSATVDASAAMLDFYCNQTHRKPDFVVVTVTKDDLNRNGYRAQRSKTYLDLDKSNELPEKDYLVLREARENIRGFFVSALLNLKPGTGGGNRKDVKAYDGKPLTAKNQFELSLLENFQVAGDWFGMLKRETEKRGLPAPIIVLMPTTDKYRSFHDEFVKSPNYEQVHAQIIEAIKTAGLDYIDHWADARTDYDKFRDPYHLRPSGQAWFTDRFARALAPRLAAATQPASQPASQPAASQAP